MFKLHFTRNLGKMHWYFIDDRRKQAQQLVQVWRCPVQLDVTMRCSQTPHNQLLLLCHYAWQGRGTAVASEPHLLSCLRLIGTAVCRHGDRRSAYECTLADIIGDSGVTLRLSLVPVSDFFFFLTNNQDLTLMWLLVGLKGTCPPLTK